MSTKAQREAAKRREAGRRKRALVLVGLGAALVIASLFLVFRNLEPAAPEGTAAQIARGEQLYAQNCAACHGETGEGHVVPEAPALNGNEHAWHHADGQLQRIILDGGEVMPPFRGTLSGADASAIIRYIQTWWQVGQLQSQQSISGQDPLQ